MMATTTTMHRFTMCTLVGLLRYNYVQFYYVYYGMMSEVKQYAGVLCVAWTIVGWLRYNYVQFYYVYYGMMSKVKLYAGLLFVA